MSQARSKKQIVFSLVILAAVVIGGYLLWNRTKTPVVLYRSMEIRRDTVVISILATGTVQPENRLEIKPPIAGRIEKVLVQEGDRVRKGQILAWMSSSERAALMDAARSQGTDEVKKWEELYRSTPIMAPINGTIIARKVESGQTFANTESIMVMSDRLMIQAQVDETDIAQIKVHQPAQIILDAYPGAPLEGHVLQIAYEATTVNNVTTYNIDVLPHTIPEFMRSGMTANLNFKIQSKENVVVVPNEAIKADNGRSIVLVRDPESQDPREQKIETGITDGKVTEVISGLKEGDQVLTVELKSSDNKSSSSPFSPMGRPRAGARGGGARGGH